MLQSLAAVPSIMALGLADTQLTSTIGATRSGPLVGRTVVYSHSSKDPSIGTTKRAMTLSMASRAQYTLPLAAGTMLFVSP